MTEPEKELHRKVQIPAQLLRSQGTEMPPVRAVFAMRSSMGRSSLLPSYRDIASS